MIREARQQDCSNLAVLSSQVWLETYANQDIRRECLRYVRSTFTQSYFLALLANDTYRLLVSEVDHRLQGLVLINLTSQFATPANGFEIEKLYVIPIWISNWSDYCAGKLT